MRLLFVARIKEFGGERVEAAARGVDVDEWKSVRVSSIREQNVNPLASRVNPATRARESEMTESVGGQRAARRRIGRRGELPSDGARLVKIRRHVRLKKSARLKAQKLRARRDELFGEPHGLARV